MGFHQLKAHPCPAEGNDVKFFRAAAPPRTVANGFYRQPAGREVVIHAGMYIVCVCGDLLKDHWPIRLASEYLNNV